VRADNGEKTMNDFQPPSGDSAGIAARESLGMAGAGRQIEVKDAELASLRAELANLTLEIQELRDVAAAARAEAVAQRTAFVRARQEVTERDRVSETSPGETTMLDEAPSDAPEPNPAIATMRGDITPRNDALTRTRRIPKIVQLLNRVVFRKKPIRLADRARDAGEWAVAAHYYRMALDRNPNRPEIWIQYGHVLKEVDRLSLAEQAYKQAIARAPTLAEPYRYLGDVLSAQRKLDGAATAYLQAQSLDPTSPDALSGLGKLGWANQDLAALEYIGMNKGPIEGAAQPLKSDRRFPDKPKVPRFATGGSGAIYQLDPTNR
jgi:tetratricopeptide (TPR) repeat protein